jgi:hypothetical protein
MADSQLAKVWSYGAFRRGLTPFALAAVASGCAWYFASQQTTNFNAHQSQLIKRV